VVIDAGPGTALPEFLTEEDIRKIDVLLISHADRDHIEGVISLIESQNVTIDVIRLNTDSMKGSKLWDDLTYELDQANRAGNLQFEVGDKFVRQFGRVDHVPKMDAHIPLILPVIKEYGPEAFSPRGSASDTAPTASPCSRGVAGASTDQQLNAKIQLSYPLNYI